MDIRLCRLCQDRPAGDAEHFWFCSECYQEVMDEQFMDQLPEIQAWERDHEDDSD